MNDSCNNNVVSTHSPSQCQICKALKSKNEYLLKILTKFTIGRDNLDVLLAQKKCMFDKADLGYTYDKKTKFFKNFFLILSKCPTPHLQDAIIACTKIIPL